MATFPNSIHLSKLHQSLSRRSLMREMGIASALAVVPAAALASPHRSDAKLLDLHKQWVAAMADHDDKCVEELRTFDIVQEEWLSLRPSGITMKSTNGRTTLMSEEDIKMFAGLRPKGWAEAKLKALADYHDVRKAIRDRVGNAVAEAAAEASYDHKSQIEDDIHATPADGLAGVLVKLEVIREKLGDETDVEFWNDILRSAHDDMKRLVQS
jgi:hypothetical protein